MLFSSSNAGGAVGANGGGGAGGNAPANTDQAIAGDGADGIPINITGTTYYWGGGGGGGQYSGTSAGNGGKGGGGGGNGSQQSEQPGTGGTDGITNGEDGDPDGDGSPTAGSGGAHTGGGGGGTGRTTGSPNAISGAGGSGIVIIKIHRDITHKKVVLKYDYKEDKKYPTIAADDTNLLAHYKFDGDFTDSSGNGNDLTVGAGTPTTTNTEKVIGESANLLTDLHYLKNDTISLANKEFSVAFWIKMTSSASNHFFITQGTTSNNNYLQIGWGGNKYFLGFWNNDLNSSTVYSGDINNWVHLVFMVRSNNNQVIYRNGIEIASRANTTAFNGSGDLRVGIRRDDVATDSFTGYMDDLRIYDKALSETEIVTYINKV